MTDTADVCPRCGDVGSKVVADGNRFHCFNGHVWGLEVEQAGDDPVNAPAHYQQGSIECIAAIESSLTPEEFRGHLKACVMKYLWRANHKGDTLGDVRKAQTYLDWLVERTK